MAGAQAEAMVKIDPELEAILKTMPEVPRLQDDIYAVRAMMSERRNAMAAVQQDDVSGIEEVDITAPARDGYQIPVRVYKPETPPAGGSPLIVFYHGGGFCLGGLENEEVNCRRFAKEFGAVCVNVDYRLAPEHPFPVPINDSWDACKWAAANASRLGADPSKGFIVGGTSAGGNISAVISLLARDEKLSPPLTGQCLLIPALMDYRAIPEEYKLEVVSYEQNKDAAILGLPQIQMLQKNYKPDITSTLYNVFAPPANHKTLPATYLQVCGMDPLRDEAIIFERRLKEHGTATKIDIYPGVPHGFQSFFPTISLSKQFMEDTLKGVAWLLKQA